MMIILKFNSALVAKGWKWKYLNSRAEGSVSEFESRRQELGKYH